MKMVRKQIAYNRTKRAQQPTYIVIHDTGNTSAGANAEAHFRYFNGGNRGSSADFFVDDTQVLQINDYTVYYSWHCGDGKGKYSVTNGNSIGVEICINRDGDYEVAVENAAELTKQLMKELGISVDRVVRHYDASRKNCPTSMRENGWERWKKFKEQIMKEESSVARTVMQLPEEIYIQEIAPADFEIMPCDCAKRDVSLPNYFNCGYFAVEKGGKTIPVGNLANNGEIYAQAKDNADWLNLAGHQLTTIYTTDDGKCGIVKTDDLGAIPNLKTAVSGIPIIVGGKYVSLNEIKSEGYFGNELYDTWHGFLGIRHNKLVYVAMKCGFDEMCWALVALGIYDAVKLDGGGSFILKNGEILKNTSENRRIHNVGVWKG